MTLEEKIIHYRQAYWEGNPLISDKEYDDLIIELEQIDPEHPLLNIVESSEEIIDKIFHSQAMLSLEKKYSFDEVYKWMKSVARNNDELFIIMPKYDGCASRYYSETKTLATRGDGSYGENISDKIPLIKGLDSEFDKDGEIIISFGDFEKCSLTRKDNSKYKSPRNLVAGILNLKEIDNAIGKVELTFMSYDQFKVEVKLSDFTYEMFESVRINTKASSPYPLDGLVFKLKDEAYGITLGFTAHHYRHSIAFKDYDEEFETVIEDIILQHGKNKLTPVAIVTPININGVTVIRASLHNAKNILDNDIQIGDKAYIIRSNDVIPYITKTIPTADRKRPIFNCCNICDAPLEYREPELYCTNKECTGNLVVQLLNSCRSLDIEEIGKPTIEKMVYDADIDNLPELLNISLNNILHLPGFSTISANKLYNNINLIKKGTYDYKILAALNIPGIGIGLFKDIMSKVNIDELLNVTLEQLMLFNNLGYDRSMNILNGLQSNKETLDQLRNIINVIETKNLNPTVKPKICFSGTFDKPKNYYYNLAKQKGFEVIDSVTRDLKYLVTSGAQTGKVGKASHYGIKILSCEDFIKL